MKKLGIFITIVLVGALCFGISRTVQNSDEYQEQVKHVNFRAVFGVYD